MNIRFSVTLAALLATSGIAFAQQYRWVDEKGRVQYSDTPPPASAKEVRKRGLGSPPVKSEAQVPFELQRAQADFPVTLYTAPICKQPCTLAREALNKRGVPFKEVQVWNVETLDQLKAVAPSDSVPALVVGRSVQSGFDSNRYESLLDLAGYPKAGVLPAGKQAAPALPDGYEPPPVAEPVAPAPEVPLKKAGRYDPSGLPSNRSGKPGPYDPSGLPSNRSGKPGPYGVPDPDGK
jgi:glutaredoxin